MTTKNSSHYLRYDNENTKPKINLKLKIVSHSFIKIYKKKGVLTLKNLVKKNVIKGVKSL